MTGPANVDAVLREYRAQVLRWNRQISLVSRQDTEQILDRLLVQCRDGAQAVLDLGLEPGSLAYFDLGSGGGIPGVVWHLMMEAEGRAPRTCLVEPREKRAWFLERMRGLDGMPDYSVSAARWGENQAEVLKASTVLVSLKALKLSDTEILAGLPQVDGGRQLVIARYYPPGEVWGPDLAEDLQIPDAGSDVAGGGVGWRSHGGRVLPGEDFSLVISAYGGPSS